MGMMTTQRHRRAFWLSAVAVVLTVVCGGSPAAAGSPAQVAATPTRAPSFVGNDHGRLVLDGRTFRFTGANMYWLGLDDNIRDAAGRPTQPTRARIDNALQNAAAAGMTVVRAHTLGISVGCPVCFEPSRGVFDDRALAAADYAIARAAALGLKLMIPLTDQWRWYHGGISTFTGWRGYPNYGNPTDNRVNAANDSRQRASEAHFYTDPVVRADFRDYVGRLARHVNPHTGRAWKDEPAILAWETGNEIWTANPTWTADLARYLKRDVGVRQLVADGTAATGMRVADAATGSADVDILGGHFYPVDTTWAARDAAVAAAAGKAYIVGEYAWTDIAATRALLGLVQSDRRISGALLWTMLPYDESGRPVPHGDGYSFYRPATTPTMQSVQDLVTAHARTLRSGG